MLKGNTTLLTQDDAAEAQLNANSILPRSNGPSALVLTLICIAIAWGGPFLICLVTGSGVHGVSEYLWDPTVWCKYIIAIAALLLSGDMVIGKLRGILTHFMRTPLLVPEDMPRLAKAHASALALRDNRAVIAVCLVLAYLTSWWIANQNLGFGRLNWAIIDTAQGHRLSAAGRWANLVSLPLLCFLLYRGLWLHGVWSRLLVTVSRLPMRLVVDHPDGKGGLAFAASYATAHWPFVLAVSASLSAALAPPLRSGQLDMPSYIAVVQGVMIVTVLIFALPMLAFTPVLGRLKKQALLSYAAQATRERRRAEREATGHNMAVDPDPCAEGDADTPDANKLYSAASKLGTVLVSRAALVPVLAAMLLPFGFAAASQLPIKQIFKVLKGVLML